MKLFIIWFPNVISTNRRYFKGFRQANSSKLSLFLKNLFSPHWIFMRAKYGQILWLPNFLHKDEALISVDTDKINKDEVAACVQQLSDDGLVVLDGYFQNR